MKIKLFNVALGIVLTATTISASAQKTYNEGVINLSTSMRGQQVEAGEGCLPAGRAAILRVYCFSP